MRCGESSLPSCVVRGSEDQPFYRPRRHFAALPYRPLERFPVPGPGLIDRVSQQQRRERLDIIKPRLFRQPFHLPAVELAEIDGVEIFDSDDFVGGLRVMGITALPRSQKWTLH